MISIQAVSEKSGIVDLRQPAISGTTISISPKIDIQTVPGSEAIHYETLVQLHDIAFVKIDNASKHSGIPTPVISFSAIIDLSKRVLIVEVSTEMKRSLTDQAKAKLQKIRDN